MYYIIFNPTAGAGRSHKAMQIVAQRLKENNADFVIAETEYKHHAVELARGAVGQGYRGIISVGGDGTLLEIAGQLEGTVEKLGIIPAGTGNDFRQAIGVPKDVGEALDIILNGHTNRVDIGFLGDQPFLNVAGTGFDVEVIYNTEKVRRLFTGGFAYFLGIFMSIFGHKNIDIDITANGQTFKRKVLLIAVANGKCYGGGLRVAPDASVSDGMFNVVILNSLPKWRILLELPKLKKGQLERIDVSEQFSCSEIIIDSSSPKSFNLDGEVYGKTPQRLYVKPSALNVFCPK